MCQNIFALFYFWRNFFIVICVLKSTKVGQEGKGIAQGEVSQRMDGRIDVYIIPRWMETGNPAAIIRSQSLNKGAPPFFFGSILYILLFNILTLSF